MNRTIKEYNSNIHPIVHIVDMKYKRDTLCGRRHTNTTYGGAVMYNDWEYTNYDELPTCEKCLELYLDILKTKEGKK